MEHQHENSTKQAVPRSSPKPRLPPYGGSQQEGSAKRKEHNRLRLWNSSGEGKRWHSIHSPLIFTLENKCWTRPVAGLPAPCNSWPPAQVLPLRPLRPWREKIPIFACPIRGEGRGVPHAKAAKVAGEREERAGRVLVLAPRRREPQPLSYSMEPDKNPRRRDSDFVGKDEIVPGLDAKPNVVMNAVVSPTRLPLTAACCNVLP